MTTTTKSPLTPAIEREIRCQINQSNNYHIERIRDAAYMASDAAFKAEAAGKDIPEAAAFATRLKAFLDSDPMAEWVFKNL